MKQNILIVLFLFSIQAVALQPSKIRLLVRADDIASFHDANIACIQSANEGIVRSIEIMVNCSWFPEAVEMLNKNPSVDVGLHLMVTSEWDEIKWRPLTTASSITDKNGYFYPSIWGAQDDTKHLLHANWNIKELEKELRAQIELGKKNLPQASHISAHMGFSHMAPVVKNLVNKLAGEYHLATEDEITVQSFDGWGDATNSKEAIARFIVNLRELKPGDYLFVEHPGLDRSEMQAVKRNVAADRQIVTDVFTSPEVKSAIDELGIELVSYSDLINTKN